MSDAYIGEIRMFGGNFAPQNWALCQGQILSISQNTALFSILGTTYGGNGTTTFGLPDLRGRVPIQQGQGPGLSPYVLGQVAGSENVTLIVTQIPAHNHLLIASSAPGVVDAPANLQLAGANGTAIYGSGSNTNMSPQSISSTGGNQPHTNIQPYLALNFIICLYGIYPSRG